MCALNKSTRGESTRLNRENLYCYNNWIPVGISHPLAPAKKYQTRGKHFDQRAHHRSWLVLDTSNEVPVTAPPPRYRCRHASLFTNPHAHRVITVQYQLRPKRRLSPPKKHSNAERPCVLSVFSYHYQLQTVSPIPSTPLAFPRLPRHLSAAPAPMLPPLPLAQRGPEQAPLPC